MGASGYVHVCAVLLFGSFPLSLALDGNVRQRVVYAANVGDARAVLAYVGAGMGCVGGSWIKLIERWC